MSNMLTEVRLLAVPLENDYKHTLYFADPISQAEYFQNRTRKKVENASYQRKEKMIRFPAHIDSLMGCNYVMYRNEGTSTKYYYAFITKMEYKNDEMTEIYIESDVIQTWLFDYVVKPSFIEREHVNSDMVGEHTIPEKLETGDYICNNHTKAGYCSDNDMVIVVGTTKTPDGENVRGKLYNNIYSGINYYTFPHTIEGAHQLETWLAGFAGDGAVEAVTCMFLAPKKLTQLKDDHTTTGGADIDTQYINSADTESTINTIIDITDETLNGYTPRNNKLLTFPYRYLLTSNNAGAGVVYNYEYFTELMNPVNGMYPIIKPRFKIEGALTAGCSIRMIPMNYKFEERNDEEGINLGKFPCLSWTSDIYTNWLTQNGVNIGLSAVGSVGSIIAGIGLMTTGAGALAGAGAVASGVMGIASTMGEVYQHSLQPPQAEGNLNSGDVVTASGNNDFHFYDMTIKKEYAKIIDSYFDMFGYKVNRVGVPSNNHRENYWYIKTIDVNIDANIPMEDVQKIKNVYNNGFTFWSNHANIGNYNLSNTCTG